MKVSNKKICFSFFIFHFCDLSKVIMILATLKMHFFLAWHFSNCGRASRWSLNPITQGKHAHRYINSIPMVGSHALLVYICAASHSREILEILKILLKDCNSSVITIIAKQVNKYRTGFTCMACITCHPERSLSHAMGCIYQPPEGIFGGILVITLNDYKCVN